MTVKWSEWKSLSPDKFERRLQGRLLNDLYYLDFVGLYNFLVASAETHPEYVSDLSKRLARLLTRKRRSHEAILFWEFLVRSCVANGNFYECLFALAQIRELDVDQEFGDLVRELSVTIANNADHFGSSVDVQPKIFSAVMIELGAYGYHEEIARLHLRAAQIYSRHGASQAAYRSVADAEEAAYSLQSSSLLARVYAVGVQVACEEEDFEWAVKAATSALTVYGQMEQEVPAIIRSNFGVALMRLNRPVEAIAQFEIALAAAAVPVERGLIQMNFAPSLRMAGRVEDAWEMALEARTNIADRVDPEYRLELALVTARIAGERRDESALVSYLNAACTLLDEALAGIFRLHHRRGLRERYIPRFEALLRDFPQEGLAEAALGAIVTVRSNAMGDWLALRAWADDVASAASISVEAKTDLNLLIDRMRNWGAPHLFGFLEKYDDAWSPGNFGEVWDDLSILSSSLKREGAALPMTHARHARGLMLCRTRLAEGHCIAAVTYAGENPILWMFAGEKYSRVELSHSTVLNWKRAVQAHGRAEISRAEFNRAIEACLDQFWIEMAPAFDVVATSEAKSLLFLQDFSDTAPLTLLALRHERLAERMVSGAFHVRVIPAIWEGTERALERPFVVGITDGAEDLLLPPIEGAMFAAQAGASSFAELNSSEDNTVEYALKTADILVVSTHSLPLQHYSDPYFAHMGDINDHHPISVDGLQQLGDKSNLSLVLLNACHSGTGSARNFQKAFRTSDLVSFPALFALNKRAVTSAGGWNTSDTVAFLHTYMVAEGFRQGHLPSAAVAAAIARLPRLTKTDALQMLEAIPDQQKRERALARLSGAPEVGLFSRPYVSGGTVVHGLM